MQRASRLESPDPRRTASRPDHTDLSLAGAHIPTAVAKLQVPGTSNVLGPDLPDPDRPGCRGWLSTPEYCTRYSREQVPDEFHCTPSTSTLYSVHVQLEHKRTNTIVPGT